MQHGSFRGIKEVLVLVGIGSVAEGRESFEETADISIHAINRTAGRRPSPASLAPLLQMRTLVTQCGVVTVPRVHHSVVSLDAEQLAADVTQ